MYVDQAWKLSSRVERAGHGHDVRSSCGEPEQQKSLRLPDPAAVHHDGVLEYRYRRRLVHYHYVSSTKEFHQLHHAAMTHPLYSLRGRLFLHAGGAWKGESFDLKAALIQAMQEWDDVTRPMQPTHLECGRKMMVSMRLAVYDRGCAQCAERSGRALGSG